MNKAFLDSNVLVYAFTRDPRSDPALSLMQAGATIGVQSLNEFVNVASRKRGMDWSATRSAVDKIRRLCVVDGDMDLAMHKHGLAIAERHRLAIYAGLIVAAALRARCDTLWSEDMHDGLVVGERLTIRNPFVS